MADEFQSKATEMMKKILTLGVGAIFLTEESLRALASEFKLPKELLTQLFESAGKTKNEFLRNLSQDVLSRITDRIDPAALLEEFLLRNDVDLHVRVSVKPKSSKKS